MGSANGCGLGEVNARRPTSLPDESGGKNMAPRAMSLGIDARRKPLPWVSLGPQLAVSAVNEPCRSASSAGKSEAILTLIGAAIVPKNAAIGEPTVPLPAPRRPSRSRDGEGAGVRESVRRLVA